MQRLLKPNALVGVVWNVEDCLCRPLPSLSAAFPPLFWSFPLVDKPPDNKPKDWPASTLWEQHVNDLIYALGTDGNPRFRDARWQAAFVEAAATTPPLFSPLEDERVRWSVQLTPEALWKRLLTLSQVANLPEGDDDDGTEKPASRGAFRRRLDAILANVERNAAGELTVHAVTYYAWARRV